MSAPNLNYLPDDLDVVKRKLKIEITDDSESDTLLDFCFTASRLINKKTKRIFKAYQEVKYFNLPTGADLEIPDLQSIVNPPDGLGLTVNGTLIDPNLYLLGPYYLTEEVTYFNMITKVYSGFPTPWLLAVPDMYINRPRAIAIDALWGYSLTPPIDIIQATYIIVSRLWSSYLKNYKSSGGSSFTGINKTSESRLIDDQVLELLDDYIRKNARFNSMIIGTQSRSIIPDYIP